eukprot:symbB.v1.2.006198.t1/scaffold355.1/size243294/8
MQVNRNSVFHRFGLRCFNLFERLSWLFQWNADVLPADCKLAPGFEVRLAEDDPAKEASKRWQCRNSPFQLELPLGHCYSLQLRAVLRDSSDVVWASSLSAPARVDLRQNGRSKQRMEASGKPRFQDFLAMKPSERRLDPYRSSPATSPSPRAQRIGEKPGQHNA